MKALILIGLFFIAGCQSTGSGNYSPKNVTIQGTIQEIKTYNPTSTQMIDPADVLVAIRVDGSHNSNLGNETLYFLVPSSADLNLLPGHRVIIETIPPKEKTPPHRPQYYFHM